MKKILTFFTGVLLAASTCAQSTPEWEINNIENQFGKYTTVDGNGDIVVVGNGAYFSFGSLNIYVKKYDSSGNLLWETTVAAIQDPNSGVTEMVHANWLGTDSQNNILITGYKFITTSGSCFPSNICIVPIGLKVYKLNSEGNLIYNQTHEDLGGGDLNSFAQPNWGEIDESDNLYVSTNGLYTDTQGDTEFGPVLLKFDPTGALLWSDVQDIFSNTISDEGLDYNNERIAMVAGKTTGAGAVLLWDETGNLLWQNPSPAGAYDYTDVYLDDAGNVYALSWWWEAPFPTQKVNVTKYNLMGTQVFSQTYLFDEPTTPGRMEPLPSGDIVIAATNWTATGQGTLYAKIISATDGSELQAFTSALPHVSSRVWDLKISAAGNFYVAGRSDTNAGAPATGWIRGFNSNGAEWSADYDVRDVMAIDLTDQEEIYLVTENTWNLVKYQSDLPSSVPCELPYPTVTGLSATQNTNGSVDLNWNAIQGSIGCQVNIVEVSTLNSVTLTVLSPEVASFTIPSNPLTAGESYAFRVRCGCSQNPPIVGPWSPYETFIYGGSGIVGYSFNPAFKELASDGELLPWRLSNLGGKDSELYPNPARDEFFIKTEGDFSPSMKIELYTIDGRLIRSLNNISGLQTIRVERGSLTDGVYMIKIIDGGDIFTHKLILN